MRARILLLIVLAGLSFFAGLGRPAIGDSDEAYYAEAGREMAEGGDWLTPHYNYEFRFQKPILFYWLVAGAYRVAGVGEASARFWAAASGLGLALLTFGIGRRLYDDDTAFIAGAIAGTSLGYFGIARMSLPDLPLAFFITLSTWAALRALDAVRADRQQGLHRTAGLSWVVVAAAAAGLAFLTKGPVGVVLPGIVAATVAAIEWWRPSPGARGALSEVGRDSGEGRRMPFSWRHLALAAAVFAAVAAPWYAGMWRVHGDAYLRSFFVGDNLERFATTRFNGPRSLFFYLPVVVGGMLPWSPFLFLLVPPAGRLLSRRRRLSAVEVRLLAWAALPLVVFTVSVGKQPRYILPVLPPLAILVARALHRRLAAQPAAGQDGAGQRGAAGQDRRPADTIPSPALAGESVEVRARHADWLVRVWATVSGLIVIAMGVGIYLLRPLLLGTPAATVAGIALLVALAGVAVVVVAWSAAWRNVPAVLAPAAVVMLLGAQYTILSSAGPEPVQQAASIMLANLRPGDRWTTYDAPPDGGAFVRNLVFYVGQKEAGPYTDRDMIDALRSDRRLVFAAPQGDLAQLEATSGVRARRLGQVLYFNTAALTPGRLLDPDPAREVRTIVIAANR